RVPMATVKSLIATAERALLMVLPHGGQRGARRNAWHAMVEGRRAAGVDEPTEAPYTTSKPAALMTAD
ncbi:MAG TPA: hypothetical protein VKP11_04705, partial [Frankiaceae bacterium]|nr:hypothetical protein [Frankiaceae bacterium]